jgi:hypothetical protein
MVSRFIFSVAPGWMESRMLYKTSTGSLALTLTIKDISQYKLEPFVLAKHVAQVFYVLDTINKRLKVVIPRKRQIIGVENAIDEEEFDQFDEIPPFITSMIKPRIPSANEAPYLRNDHHEKNQEL